MMPIERRSRSWVGGGKGGAWLGAHLGVAGRWEGRESAAEWSGGAQ